MGESRVTSRSSNIRAVPIWQFLIPLLVVTAIYTTGRSILAFHGLIKSPEADLFRSFVFNIILAGWVYFDRRVRGFSVPFEFDAFMFFAWIFLLPYYLYRTRGRRGLLLLAGVYALAVIPDLAASIVYASSRSGYVR
jgi:hypothetical protein